MSHDRYAPAPVLATPAPCQFVILVILQAAGGLSPVAGLGIEAGSRIQAGAIIRKSGACACSAASLALS